MEGAGGWITLLCMAIQMIKGKYLPNPPACDLPNP